MANTIFTPEGGNGTPFTRDNQGLDLLDTVNGMAQRSARTWQVVALCALAAFFIALGVLVYAETLPRTVPVLVALEPTGKAINIGAVDSSNYHTPIPEIARTYMIKQLINNTHTWVTDKDAQNRYIAEAQASVQRGAINELDQFFREHNPFTYFGQMTQSVDIEPIHRQADKTYLTYFKVTRRNAQGTPVAASRYSILVNLDEFAPTGANPLGIFITNFDIKLLEAAK
jgi:type IV secretory pathway TrbF-like protein